MSHEVKYEVRLHTFINEEQMKKWMQLKELFDTNGDAKTFKKFLDKGEIKIE